MADSRVRLSAVDSAEPMWQGGTVAYRVHVDGVWVGWVGDGREWRGYRYGGRRWWTAWRQDGDTAARWSSELEHRTRGAALAALLERVSPAEVPAALAADTAPPPEQASDPT